MTDKEQIERISKLLNELSLDDITSTEFDEEFPKRSIIELKDELWRMYCFAGDVSDTINMGDTAEQEPCEDCISRRAVINAIYANSVGENEYNLTSSRIKKAVEELPSINLQEPKTEWIPVDEQLPEPWASVLITFSGKYGNLTADHAVGIGSWDGGNGWHFEEIEGYTEQLTVDAWMNPPEPYKGE